MGIPKRIIQTDKSRDLPLPSKAAVANLRLLNPDFEYLFFDDTHVREFIDAEFPEYRPVFNSFPVKIQRYDFIRYLAGCLPNIFG
jgi:mannosyltransferase OCH1-like enzyme